MVGAPNHPAISWRSGAHDPSHRVVVSKTLVHGPLALGHVYLDWTNGAALQTFLPLWNAGYFQPAEQEASTSAPGAPHTAVSVADASVGWAVELNA